MEKSVLEATLEIDLATPIKWAIAISLAFTLGFIVAKWFYNRKNQKIENLEIDLY